MTTIGEAYSQLAAIPHLQVTRNERLAQHTRFGFGGPAAVFASTADEAAFVAALRCLSSTRLDWIVIGDGTNLIVSDAGYAGIVLRYRGSAIHAKGSLVRVQAGAALQDLVDHTIASGLAGLQSLTGIPGTVGAAIYGNAGAYGTSISDLIAHVRYFDGEQIRETDHEGCEFRYRSSIFKRQRLAGRPWLILSADFRLQAGDSAGLSADASKIRATRDAKYPPDMKCAGSIFKNLILADLPAAARAVVPPSIVKGGKVPAAWFLEQAGAKGLRNGGVAVAEHHSNLIYNEGSGTAAQARELIALLKRQVKETFQIELEEEVQFMGFDDRLPGVDNLSTTPQVIQGLISGLSRDELHWTPAEGRWSIAQVLAHLAHVERQCFHLRASAMVTEDNPEIEPYDPVAFEKAGAYETRFALAALEDFLSARRDSLEFLSSVPLDAVTRPARHKEYGPLALGELLNEWAFHDLGHVRQIAEIVRSVKYYPHMGPFRPLYKVNP